MSQNKISGKVIGSIIAAGIMSFCGVVVETAMNIAFPVLMKEFNIGTSTVQWMTTSYLLIVAIIVPLSAFFKRRFTNKKLFVISNILFIIGLILDAIAPIFPVLLLGRIIQGMGTGMALPLMFNIILEQVPTSKIGMMMGVGGLITAIAPAIGPTFGGIVVSLLNWRYVFIFLLPLLIISLICGIVSIQQVTKTKKVSLDILSLLWIAITFIGIVFGFSEMGKGNIININTLLPIIIGIVGLILFVHRSNNINNPIINLKVLKNSGFSLNALSFFILQFITLGLSFVLPNYIQLVNHNTASLAGIVVFPGAAIGAIFAPLSGKILDKFGAKKPLMTGSSFGFISILLFIIFGMYLNNSMIAIFYIIYMLCMGLSFGNLMTNALSNLSNQLQTDGNAILNTLQQLAGAVGTSIVSAIVANSQVTNNGSMSHLTAIGSTHAFIFLFILIIIEACSLLIFFHKKDKNVN